MLSISYLFEVLTGFEQDYQSNTEPPSLKFPLSKFYKNLQLKELARKKQEK